MSELETTSLQLQTNKIHDKLRNILDFFMGIGEHELIIDGTGPYIVFCSRVFSPGIPDECGIEILDSGSAARSLKLLVKNHGSEHEMVTVDSFYEPVESEKPHINYFIESNKILVRELSTDGILLKVLPPNFHKLLMNLNENIIKTKMV